MISKSRRCKRVNPVYANEIIDLLGGTGSVSKICDIKDASVSEWRKLGMPKGRFMFLSERFKRIVKQPYSKKHDLFV